VNRKISEGLEKSSFITMLAILFDVDRMRALVCRAGHNTLFYKNASSGEIKVIRPTGIGLGIHRDRGFEKKVEELVFSFSGGDYFILYSDGLTEARNPDYELFGEERVMKIISASNYSSPAQLRDILLDEVAHFRKNEEQNDDITVVILKIKDPS
jgi:sigma-B regulation protein RsbU (phosphoserine phosphatase)